MLIVARRGGERI